MNKAELIGALESKLGSKKAASDALEAVLDVIIREVAKGGKVGITGFGTFQKVARGARTGRNPRTGETVKIKKTTVPKFNAGTAFKKVVADPRQLPKAAAAGGRASAGAAVKATTAAAGATKTAAKRATSTAKSAATKTAKAAPAKATPAKKATTDEGGGDQDRQGCSGQGDAGQEGHDDEGGRDQDRDQDGQGGSGEEGDRDEGRGHEGRSGQEGRDEEGHSGQDDDTPGGQEGLTHNPGMTNRVDPFGVRPVRRSRVVREGRRRRQRIGWPSPIPTIQRRVTVSPPSSTLTR